MIYYSYAVQMTSSSNQKITLLFKLCWRVMCPGEGFRQDYDRNLALHINQIDLLTADVIAEIIELKKCTHSMDVWNVFAVARTLVDSYRKTGKTYLPRFFISTMFKSGTKHLERLLRQFYGLKCSQLHEGNTLGHGSHVSPKNINDKFNSFFSGFSFASSHYECCPENISFIDDLCLPVIVLLRNPAQAAVSAFYYIKALSQRDSLSIQSYLASTGLLYDPTGSVNSLEDLQHFLYTQHFDRQVLFASRWLDYFSQTSSSRSLLLFHEHLSCDEKFFHSQIHEFVNMPMIKSASLQQLNNPNFRKGLTQEWKEAVPTSRREIMSQSLASLIQKHTFLAQVWNID